MSRHIPNRTVSMRILDVVTIWRQVGTESGGSTSPADGGLTRSKAMKPFEILKG